MKDNINRNIRDLLNNNVSSYIVNALMYKHGEHKINALNNALIELKELETLIKHRIEDIKEEE